MRHLTLLLLLLATPAVAGEAEAEQARLRAEMQSLAERTAWKGVDRSYEALAALGVPLTYADHWMGAQASKTLGDVNDTLQRLRAAEAIEGKEEVYVELAQLFAAYGLVEIKVSRKHDAPALTALELPFDPVMVRTIEAASATLQESRRYEGLLPLGRYEVAGTRFDLVGEPLVKVKAR